MGARLKGELEEINIAHEGTLAALRQKHNNTMAELGEQIDNLSANKVKAEKDKAGMERDLQEARSSLEDAVREKAELDKNGKLLQGSIVDINQKLDEMARALNEADSQKKRLDVEKQDLERQIEEGENAMASLNKSKISLTTQLEDTKRMGESEGRDRSALLSKFKNLSTELQNTRERIEDEHQRKSDALKALSKAQAEIQLWRSRFETEGMGRVDELEMSRNKLQARIQEAEENVESLNVKIANSEKSRARMQSDLEELSMDYERTHAAAIITEKRGKNFDKVIGEWKAATTTVSSTGSRLLMMRLLSNLMLSRGRTRTWLMRSRIFLTNWVMVVGPSMSWTSNVVAWRLRRKNFKLPLRKLKQHWSKRRTRFLGLNLSLDRSVKRLTAVSKRRRKSLITLARTINVPWTPWVLPLKLNSVPRLRLSVSRRSLNLTSMSLKLPLTMPTRPMLKAKRLSSATKANSVIPSKAMKNKPEAVKRSKKLLVLLNAKPMLFQERLKSLVLFWTLLIALSVNWMLSWVMPAMLSMRCKSSTLRPCMISVVLSLSSTLCKLRLMML